MILTTHVDADGHLVVVGRAARTGAQIYAEGPEYRDAEEVFSSESLSSWRGAPVTVGHVTWLTSANVAKHSVGYVRAVERDDAGSVSYVRATLVLHDEKVIAAVRAKELVELSAGYNAEVIDRHQRGIRINHLALLGPGRARCGSACSIGPTL